MVCKEIWSAGACPALANGKQKTTASIRHISNRDLTLFLRPVLDMQVVKLAERLVVCHQYRVDA